MKTPKIPMHPQDLPQQRIYLIKDVPQHPENWKSFVGYSGVGMPEDAKLKSRPRNPAYLFQAEWSWSPAHGSLNAYWLNKGRKYLTLYSNWFDDVTQKWTWNLVAGVPLNQASEREAAFWLVIDYARFNIANMDLDEWHMIDDVGLLTVAGLKAIARNVWQEIDKPNKSFS